MWRHIVHCMFLWVTSATKSTKSGSRYLGQGSSERDEILEQTRGEFIYKPPKTVTFGPGAPGEPIY